MPPIPISLPNVQLNGIIRTIQKMIMLNLDGKPIMYEKAFLRDIALQNYSHYNVSFVALEKLSILPGQALAINSTRFLSSTIGNYLDVFHNHSEIYQTPSYSSPYWDPIGKGIRIGRYFFSKQIAAFKFFETFTFQFYFGLNFMRCN